MPYVKDRRVRTRRALYKGGRGIAGLGGASDCGPDQIWDPQFVYAGITGQCVTPAQSAANKAAHPEQYSGAPQQSNAGWTDILTAGLNSFGKVFGAQQPGVVMAPSSGIDTTTLLIIGGVGLGAVLLLSRRGS